MNRNLARYYNANPKQMESRRGRQKMSQLSTWDARILLLKRLPTNSGHAVLDRTSTEHTAYWRIIARFRFTGNAASILVPDTDPRPTGYEARHVAYNGCITQQMRLQSHPTNNWLADSPVFVNWSSFLSRKSDLRSTTVCRVSSHMTAVTRKHEYTEKTRV